MWCGRLVERTTEALEDGKTRSTRTSVHAQTPQADARSEELHTRTRSVSVERGLCLQEVVERGCGLASEAVPGSQEMRRVMGDRSAVLKGAGGREYRGIWVCQLAWEKGSLFPAGPSTRPSESFAENLAPEASFRCGDSTRASQGWRRHATTNRNASMKRKSSQVSWRVGGCSWVRRVTGTQPVSRDAAC